jgi:hypothetical protein
VAPQCCFPMHQVRPSLMPPPSQQSPPSSLWFDEWDPQSHASYLSSTASAPPTSVTDWVADSGTTNHTTTHPGHIFSPRPPLLAQPSSIVFGNCSILLVTSVCDSVLPGPFYLNDVLLVPNLTQSLLSIHCFTTDKSCSMEFDPFGLSMKDLATRCMLARYDSIGPLCTLPLPTLITPTSRAIFYALATTASSTT